MRFAKWYMRGLFCLYTYVVLRVVVHLDWNALVSSGSMAEFQGYAKGLFGGFMTCAVLSTWLWTVQHLWQRVFGVKSNRKEEILNEEDVDESLHGSDDGGRCNALSVDDACGCGHTAVRDPGGRSSDGGGTSNDDHYGPVVAGVNRDSIVLLGLASVQAIREVESPAVTDSNESISLI